MKNLNAYLKRSDQIFGMQLMLCMVTGLLLGLFSINVLQTYSDTRARSELNSKLGKLQEYLSIATTRNRAMGVALLLGLNEPVIKRAALGETGLDAPEVLQRLHIARKQFDFEGLYVINKQGLITANDTDGIKSTNKNISFRPYYQLAMKGQETVYLAIGTNSDTRGLFVAAPIHETTEKDSSIIGVVSIKISAEALLDNILNEAGRDALLISPQGVVFAATRKQWQLAVTPSVNEKQLEEIRALQQFGKRFESTDPSILKFDPSQSIIDIDQKRFLAEHVAINWNDPNGQWLVVLMEDSSAWLTSTRKLKIIGLILLFAMVVGIVIQQQVNRTRRLKAALIRENEQRSKDQAALLAAAEERALIAKVAAELRQVQSYSELVQVFMHHAHQLLGVGLGLFYVADNAKQQLQLIGGYGVAVDDFGSEIPYGEGLAGQCALEVQSLQISQPPLDYIKIASGSGAAAPKLILLHPLILKGKLVGVLELALFNALTSKQEKMLAEFEAITAANIEMMEQRRILELEFNRQKVSEARLRYQASFQQVLIDTIPYPIFYKDSDCRFLGFNRAYEKTFDVKREQLIGKRVLELDYLPEADRIAYQEEDERVIAEVGEIQREMLIPFADGKVHRTLYCVSGFHLENGQVGGLVGIFIDFTNHSRGD